MLRKCKYMELGLRRGLQRAIEESLALGRRDKGSLLSDAAKNTHPSHKWAQLTTCVQCLSAHTNILPGGTSATCPLTFRLLQGELSKSLGDALKGQSGPFCSEVW